jgi:hypothetical protein
VSRALGLVAVAVGVTACGGGKPGLWIEVPLANGQAELFVPGEACGSACNAGITPKAATSPLVDGSGIGDVSFLDSTRRLLAPRESDGYARFQLEAGDHASLPAIYVVGFDGNDKPTGFAEVDDVHIPQSGHEEWKIVLQPATFGPARASDGDTIWVWREPLNKPYSGDPDHASCLGIEHASGSTSFIVPDDDPDCDGVKTGDPLECNAYWFEYQTPPQAGAGACTTTASVSGNPVCELGRPVACIDAIGPGCGTLEQGRVCVPDATCPACGANVTTTCLQTLFADTSVPKLRCTFPLQTTGIPCANNMTTADLSTVLSGGSCPQVGFVAGVPLATPALQLAVGTATVAVSAPASGCAFPVTWSGTAMPGAHGSSLFEVDLGNGRLLVFPFLVNFTGDCTLNQPECVIEPSPSTDHMWSCGG